MGFKNAVLRQYILEQLITKEFVHPMAIFLILTRRCLYSFRELPDDTDSIRVFRLNNKSRSARDLVPPRTFSISRSGRGAE